MQNFELQESLPQFDDGQKRKIVEGGASAISFVKKVALGEKVSGEKYNFNGDLVKAIHQRVCAWSDIGGRLREENVGVSGFDAVSWHDVPTRFYLFGRWLEHTMRRMKSEPDNLILALETAAAAHEGLTRPELHPFASGNGRTARALVNAILMSGADELRFFKIALPPVPILRSYDKEQDQKYIRALHNVRLTNSLNPLMTFIAKRWSWNLGDLILRIQREVQLKNPADKKLVEILKRRKTRLDSFTQVATGRDKGDYTIYPIPNFLDPIWLKDHEALQLSK